MKAVCKKRISVLLAVLMLPACSASVPAFVRGESGVPIERIENTEQQEFMRKQSAGLETYFAVKDTLEAGEDVLSGVYIDEDGHLNILLVSGEASGSSESETLKTVKREVDAHKADGQTVVYRSARYSLSQMRAWQEDAMEEAEVVSSYIDEKTNKLVVGVGKGTDTKRIVKSLSNLDCVAFEEVVSFEEDAAILKNGSATSNGSIACGAKMGSQYGFITAGHR